MADIQTQLPIKITNGTNTVGINGTALIVDPSGVTSPVSGTVTAVATGTYTVAGTVTNVPSGTQDVAGTVTAVPTGTYTVTGTVSTQPTGTQTITGTVATNADANVAPGAAPAKVLVGGMVYNTDAPTATNGQSLAFQSDANGNLKVAGSLTTSPSGTQAVSGTVTTVPSGTQTVVQASGSTVTCIASGSTTVTGTVTTVPSGTQTVEGTVTNVPSGTQTISGSVSVIPEAVGGVASYSTSAGVAAASTATLTYTVTTAKTLYWKGVIATSSGGPCKVIVNYGAGPTVVCVGFYSTTSPFLNIEFPQPVVLAADTVCRILIQNNNDTAQDVYGTFFGVEY